MSLYFLSAGAGLVLSSTMPNLDNCLYAKNTMSAIMRKLIMFATRWPTKKVEFPTVILAAFKFPAGKNSPMNGVIISLTKAVTNWEAACPITIYRSDEPFFFLSLILLIPAAIIVFLLIAERRLVAASHHHDQRQS